MCGFNSCNPLDFNSSFLIQNKDDDVKKLGSLWLCQKPSFDTGYSVPLRNTGQTSSTTNGGKKTWTMDDDDLIDTDELLDENDRKKPDVKSKIESFCFFGEILLKNFLVIKIMIVVQHQQVFEKHVKIVHVV